MFAWTRFHDLVVHWHTITNYFIYFSLIVPKPWCYMMGDRIISWSLCPLIHNRILYLSHFDCPKALMFHDGRRHLFKLMVTLFVDTQSWILFIYLTLEYGKAIMGDRIVLCIHNGSMSWELTILPLYKFYLLRMAQKRWCFLLGGMIPCPVHPLTHYRYHEACSTYTGLCGDLSDSHALLPQGNGIARSIDPLSGLLHWSHLLPWKPFISPWSLLGDAVHSGFLLPFAQAATGGYPEY